MSLLRRLPLLMLTGCLLAGAQFPDQTVLTINSHGKITLLLDGKVRPVKTSQLTDIFLQAGHPDQRTVSILASRNTRVGDVQTAMQAVQKAGVTHIALVDPNHP